MKQYVTERNYMKYNAMKPHIADKIDIPNDVAGKSAMNIII
jgi:hypothetical protein